MVTFSDFLYGNQFTVVADSNPFTYILNSAKFNATNYRQLVALSTISFNLQNSPTKLNGDADALLCRLHGNLCDESSSQKQWDRICQFTQHDLLDPNYTEAEDQEVVHAICERRLGHCANDGMGSDGSISLVKILDT